MARGACYVRLGRLELAEASLTDALNQPLSLRRRGSVLTDLATLGVRRRDSDQVTHYATTAVTLAEQTASGYIGRKLHGLRAQLTPLQHDSRIRDLSERITALHAITG